jgi:hypothetical protein
MIWLALRLYRAIVVSGVSVASLVYGGAAVLFSGSWIGFVLVVPYAAAFCCVIAAPLAVGGVVIASVLRRTCPLLSRRGWIAFGMALGGTLVFAAGAPYLAAGALSNIAGCAFWTTFLVAGTTAGAWSAKVAHKDLRRAQNTSATSTASSPSPP